MVFNNYQILKRGDYVMKLYVKRYLVNDIKFGDISSFDDGILLLNKESLISHSLLNRSKYSIDFDIAKPKESKRIIHITDAVKPAWKNEGSAFPGWTKGEQRAGSGITHQLDNMVVMQCCKYPGIQEGIVDMTGNGAKYSIFSSKNILVMKVNVKDTSIGKEELARDLNLMTLNVAEYAASLTKQVTSNNSDVYEIKNKSDQLPNIGYAYFIQGQGPLRNVHIYGRDSVTIKPLLIHPNEIKDGAIISGNYIIACQKNPTILHQENPVIDLLYKRDGVNLNFAGVIMSTESSTLEDKKENARIIANFAKERNMDGIIITQEGGGHADVDLMLTTEACEEKGIKTVVITNELSGIDGDLTPLVSFSMAEDAIITSGNNDEVVTLDGVDEVIGGEDLINGDIDPFSSFSTSLGILYTATNQLGANKMTSIEY